LPNRPRSDGTPDSACGGRGSRDRGTAGGRGLPGRTTGFRAAASSLVGLAPRFLRESQQREIELLGPEEVLARLGNLDPQDELVQLVGDSYE
jgi:hypothetical protein